MITKVKISPVEQWCPQMQAALLFGPPGDPSVGAIVEIETTSMRIEPPWRTNPCGGREFQVVGPDKVAFDAEKPGERRSIIGAWLCEHMLELD